MENIYNLVLDLKQKITQTEIVIPQLDNNTHKFSMKVTQNGDEYVLEDEITSELAILKTDGQFVVLPAQKMGSTYTATLTEQALTTAGITKAELRFKKNDELLTSTQFNFLVREVIVNNEKIKSTSEYKALEGLINEAKAMQESLKKGEVVLGDVNKIKEDLAEIKESILNKSKELNDKLASADEKINEINSCITKAETVLNNFENSQNKIDNLSNLLKELNKIQLTLDELNKSINNANTQKAELNASIESAKTEKSNLESKISEGKQTATNLESKTFIANATKSQLEQANTAATNAKQSLESTTATANDTKAKLDNLNRLGNTLSSDLSNKISQGGNLNSSLATSISSASTAKSNLDGSITNAESTNTSLKATDTEAKKTETSIKDLMSQLGKTENEVKQIIASGDLSKYVTDPKLQEALKLYATKDELSGKIDKSQITDDIYGGGSSNIAVSQKGLTTLINDFTQEISNQQAQINDKANKSEIPKKLSQLENDKTFKTEAEIQELINNSTKLKKEIVTSLPATGKEDVIYLLKNKGDYNNVYTEYLWINGSWEIIGDTKVDLTDYAKKADIKTRLSDMISDNTHRTVTDSEKSTWNNKVDKVDGKSLSTNDYTDSDKAKVDAIPSSPKYTDTTYGLASQSSNGLMSAADKKRLDNIKEQVALTETQYNALSSTQQNDSKKIYFIKA